MRSVLVVSAALVVFALSSCSSDDGGSSFPADGGIPNDANLVGNDTGPLLPTDGSTQPGDDCSDEAKLVYVLSSDQDLYSFAPNKAATVGKGAFVKLGPLQCPVPNGVSPNSMAVARNGTAWVNFNDGSLYSYDVKQKGPCQATNFATGQQGFIGRMGMGFSSDAPGSSAETLYVADIEAGLGLAKIDLVSLKLTKVGRFGSGLDIGGELTGSGDARLFGFFTTQPNATFAQIEKTSAAPSSPLVLDNVNTGNFWAFSFWGGDFWFYTASGLDKSSVTQMKGTNGGLNVPIPDVGFRIIGAGVSTCAPTEPPR